MKKLLLAVTITLTIMLPVMAFGADDLYRIMHNDQEALVVAEVVTSDDDLVDFNVVKSIKSENDLNKSEIIEQIEIDNFTLKRESLTGVKFFENRNVDQGFEVGETYLISLNQGEDGYQIAWGIYELSDSDYKTLDVMFPKNAPEWRIMEAMAIKEFINSDGSQNEFIFDGDNQVLKSGDRVVYDGKAKDKDEEEKREDKETVPAENIDEARKEAKAVENKGYENIIYIVLAVIVLVLLLKGKIGT